jgi:hypothetical protein
MERIFWEGLALLVGVVVFVAIFPRATTAILGSMVLAIWVTVAVTFCVVAFALAN